MSLPPDRVDYLPIIDGRASSGPAGARVAFWVAPNVEHYEYLPRLRRRPQSLAALPVSGRAGLSHFDYGNRVGFWRMLEVLDRYRIRCTVSLNLSVLDHYPRSRARCSSATGIS